LLLANDGNVAEALDASVQFMSFADDFIQRHTAEWKQQSAEEQEAKV